MQSCCWRRDGTGLFCENGLISPPVHGRLVGVVRAFDIRGEGGKADSVENFFRVLLCLQLQSAGAAGGFAGENRLAEILSGFVFEVNGLAVFYFAAAF